MREWDWDIAWEHMMEFLWEWRFPLVIFSIMAFSATAAAFAPSVMYASSGVASVAASPTMSMAPAAAVMGASAISWIPSVLAMTQIVAGAGTAAVPVFTAVWAWQNRRGFAALVWILIALMTFPAVNRYVFCCQYFAHAVCCCRRRNVEHPFYQMYRGREQDIGRKRVRSYVGGPVPRRRRLAARSTGEYADDPIFEPAIPRKRRQPDSINKENEFNDGFSTSSASVEVQGSSDDDLFDLK